MTIVIEARIGSIVRPPHNGLEILEARFFGADEIPSDLAMTMRDYLDAALAMRVGADDGVAVVFE